MDLRLLAPDHPRGRVVSTHRNPRNQLRADCSNTAAPAHQHSLRKRKKKKTGRTRKRGTELKPNTCSPLRAVAACGDSGTMADAEAAMAVCAPRAPLSCRCPRSLLYLCFFFFFLLLLVAASAGAGSAGPGGLPAGARARCGAGRCGHGAAERRAGARRASRVAGPAAGARDD